jgi:SOS-response transcriptional repressors (RecA-mediated autopeptidases)
METDFSTKLKKFREKAGYESQTKFAEACGVDNSTIARLERGETSPTPKTLDRLAPVLGMPLMELMIAAGYVHKDSSESERNTNAETFGIHFPPFRIREIRESTGLLQKEFAEMFQVNPTTYCRYESGEIKKMPADLIENISRKFDINPAWLMGFERAEKYFTLAETNQSIRRVPVLKKVTSDMLSSSQEVIDYEYVSRIVEVDFCLHASDDSMMGTRILKGDLIYVRKTEVLEHGEIGVVSHGGVLLIRRYFKVDGITILHAENFNYDDLTFGKKDVSQISILGKVVMLRAEL